MTKIASAIERYLVTSNLREPSKKTVRRYYVSDMGKCQRTRWLKRRGIGTEFTKFVYWIFAMGDMIHEFGYKALEAQGLLLQSEEALRTEHWSGRFDGIVKLDENTIFDFKSASKYAFKKAIGGADNVENIAQILTYVMMYKKLNPDVKISDSGIIVYINKEPDDVTPTVIFDREYHLTGRKEKELQEEMDMMVDFWDNNIIPKCTCPGWMKNYNSFLPFCLMKEDDIKKYLEILESDEKRVVSSKKSIFTVSEDSDGKKTKEEVFKL